MLPSPYGSRLGPRIYAFRGHIYVHCRYGPATRSLPKGDLVDRLQVSLHPTIQTTGRLTFAPAGLPPAEHTSLNWTHPSVPMIMRHLSPKSLASGRRTEITWLCRTEMRSRMVPLGLTRWEAGGRPPWQPQRRQLPNSRSGRAAARSLGRTS